MTNNPPISMRCGRCHGDGHIETIHAAIHRDYPGRLSSAGAARSCPDCQGTGWIPINH